MAGRGRFKIPKPHEMTGESNDVKPMSLFASYQQKKKETSTSSKPSTVTQAEATSHWDNAPVNILPAQGDSEHTQDFRRKTMPTAATKPKPLASVSKCVATTSAASASNGVPTSAPVSVSVPATSGMAESRLPGSSSSSSVASSAASSSVVSSSKTSTVSSGKESSETSVLEPASAVASKSTNSIIVNYRQRGNPILKHIRNVPWEYGSIVPDYVMGKANCALYLSLKYHQLNPTYLHNRLKELGKGYDLRVLLVQVDVPEPHHLLRDLAKICILADLTLILAFSYEEAGRYLETYKVYENKPAEALMEKTDTDFMSKLTDALTTVKSVNKTDCMTLISAFKTMEGIINASKEELTLCAGFGPQKAQRLYTVLHEPFLKARKRLATTTAGDSSTSAAKKPS